MSHEQGTRPEVAVKGQSFEEAARAAWAALYPNEAKEKFEDVGSSLAEVNQVATAIEAIPKLGATPLLKSYLQHKFEELQQIKDIKDAGRLRDSAMTWSRPINRLRESLEKDDAALRADLFKFVHLMEELRKPAARELYLKSTLNAEALPASLPEDTLAEVRIILSEFDETIDSIISDQSAVDGTGRLGIPRYQLETLSKFARRYNPPSGKLDQLLEEAVREKHFVDPG